MNFSRWWIPAGLLAGFLIAAVRTGLLAGDGYNPAGVGGSLVAGLAACWVVDAAVRRIRPTLNRQPRRLVIVIFACATLGLLAGTWHFVDAGYIPASTHVVGEHYAGPLSLRAWQEYWCTEQAPLQAVKCRTANGTYVVGEPAKFLFWPEMGMDSLVFGLAIGLGAYAALVLFVLSVRVLAPHTNRQ